MSFRIDEELAVPAHTFAFLPVLADLAWVEVFVMDNVVEGCGVSFFTVAWLVSLLIVAPWALSFRLLGVVATIPLG